MQVKPALMAYGEQVPKTVKKYIHKYKKTIYLQLQLICLWFIGKLSPGI